MLNKLYSAFIVLIIFSSRCISGDNFNFDFDYSIFRDDSSKVYVEFYYSFNPTELTFVKSGKGYEANGKLSVEVISKATSLPVALKDFKIPLAVPDTSASNTNFKLTGQINMMLDSGAYIFKIKASDFIDTSRSAIFTEEVLLKSYPENTLSFSTIQLANSIVKSDDVNNIFYKNTLEVTPNPSMLFGNNLAKLFYYLEIYNIQKEIVGDKYAIEVSIAEQDGIDLKSVVKNYEVKTDSKVEFGSIDITGLPSKRYVLFIKMIDSKNQELLRAYKYFYIFNSDSAADNQTLTDVESEYLLSEYPKMSENKVEEEFKRAIYLMSDKQKETFEGFKQLDEKRMYMFKYWKGISSILTKKEYFSRIDYANKNFKSDFREGWKSDRGRIYSIYGKYDEIERFPYEGSSRAYEIWTYNKLQGGATFVFIDMSAGYGDFILVHSTAQNEIRDDNWRDKLDIR